jgi:thiamine pyrophosphokinase
MSGQHRGMKALVVADGDVPGRAELDAAWPGWDDDVRLVVAADGGFRNAVALELAAHLVVGDADSLDPAELARAEAGGARVKLHPQGKDASDTELALAEALGAGAGSVTVLGALGGLRVDHALANVLLLGLDGLDDREVAILDGTTRIRLVRALGTGRRELSLRGRVGDLVSLFPLGDAEGVVTDGLEYPLRDEPLPAGTTRGLSNVRVAEAARVSLSGGRLLVVETAAPSDAPTRPDGGTR